MIPEPLFSRLLASLLTARELEREHIARLLHDQVGQVLSAVGLHLDALRLDFGDDNPGISERSVEIQQMLEEAMREVRDLSSNLNAAIAERAGLQSALRQLMDRIGPEFPGRVRLRFPSGLSIAKPLAGAIFKIAEQAVENAVRHSGATSLTVTVRPLKGGLAIEVRDDGCGFDPARARSNSFGLGLHIMAHYAAQCGARLKIITAPHAGTIVRITSGGTTGESCGKSQQRIGRRSRRQTKENSAELAATGEAVERKFSDERDHDLVKAHAE